MIRNRIILQIDYPGSGMQAVLRKKINTQSLANSFTESLHWRSCMKEAFKHLYQDIQVLSTRTDPPREF